MLSNVICSIIKSKKCPLRTFVWYNIKKINNGIPVTFYSASCTNIYRTSKACPVKNPYPIQSPEKPIHSPEKATQIHETPIQPLKTRTQIKRRRTLKKLASKKFLAFKNRRLFSFPPPH